MTQNVIIGTISAIVAVVGTVFAVSLQFVSKAQFDEYKIGSIAYLDKRFDYVEKTADDMNKKLDRIIEEQKRLAASRERGS